VSVNGSFLLRALHRFDDGALEPCLAGLHRRAHFIRVAMALVDADDAGARA
jgi:hypothetical protein